MGSIDRDNPVLVRAVWARVVGWRKTNLLAPIPCADPDLTTKQLSLAFFRPMDLCLRLVASTCAGYDDDAQICCEHGGEGGQNVSLTAEVHETTMTSGCGGPGRC